MTTYENQRLPETACHMCRRRKVKCDRAYPICNECAQRDQVCTYPAGAMKPGPRLGTIHRRKRQRKESLSNADNQDWGVSPSQDDPEPLDDDGRASNASPSPHTSCSCDRRPSFSGRENTRPRQLPVAADSSTTGDMSHDKDAAVAKETIESFNMYDLSFILHPSHEGPSPGRDLPTTVARGIFERPEPAMVAPICAALSVAESTLERAVDVYFDNMVAINLFHEPTFRGKLTSIARGSITQAQAILAAMLAFASRFYTTTPGEGGADRAPNDGQHPAEENVLEPSRFLTLAFNKIDQALTECDDEAPPLCLLQALIIATHCQLTLGVRGKAWRSLGMCIRIAYELNLHLVDANRADGYPDAQLDAQHWPEDEERRRSWWAIWEMDVFASTIRRTRPAMDWSQMETLLPVEDQAWFTNQPRPSCFMVLDPVYRWKVLQETGNESPKAWFLVVNSLMKDAQVISSPRSIPHPTPAAGESQVSHKRPKDPLEGDAARKLELLANSVHCFTLALPAHLHYRNQYLAFEGESTGSSSSLRQVHCGIYNIFVMTQLARIMIYRYGVFSGQTLGGAAPSDPGTTMPRSSTRETSTPNGFGRSRGTYFSCDREKMSFSQYFEATDNILTILTRSSVTHIQHINPFLSSTIWLASAVQLLRMQFAEDEISRTLIKSKFEALYLTYRRCVSFWDIQTALQQNLDALEAQLEGPDLTGHGALSTGQQLTNQTVVRQSNGNSVSAKRGQAARREPASTRTASSGRRPAGQPTEKSDRPIPPEPRRAKGRQGNIAAVVPPDPAAIESTIHVGHAMGGPSATDASPGQQQSQEAAAIANQVTPQGPEYAPSQGSLSTTAVPLTARDSPAGMQDMTSLDYMHISSQLDRSQPMVSDRISIHGEVDPVHEGRAHDSAGGFFEPMGMMGYLPHLPRSFAAETGDQIRDLAPDWRNLNLLSDVQNMLSGYSGYE